jgi:hypothetical protein
MIDPSVKVLMNFFICMDGASENWTQIKQTFSYEF